MCFQVYFYTKSYIEREMEYSTKTRLPLHSNGIIYPSSLLRSLQIGIILHSYCNTSGVTMARAHLDTKDYDHMW
jgi:hypothetical protein